MPTPPAIIVTGTLALDLIGHYPGRFDDQLRGPPFGLSVRLSDWETRYGGCAVNIAWNLALLGARPIPLVRAGRDFDEGYREHLEAAGIDLRGVHVDPQVPHCSRCVLLGDADGAQITAWYPGGASGAWTGAERDAAQLARECGASLAIVAPDHPDTMLMHLGRLNAAGLTVLTDPGQGIGDFSAAQLDAVVSASREIIVNANEFAALCELLSSDAAALLTRLERIVVTHGAAGIEVLGSAHELKVGAVPAHVVDTTGAGDAFRAGWALARLQGCDEGTAARVGALLAAFAVEVPGPQTHSPCMDEKQRAM